MSIGGVLSVFIPAGMIDPDDPTADGRVLAYFSSLDALSYPVQLVEATSMGPGQITGLDPGEGAFAGSSRVESDHYWTLDLISEFAPQVGSGEAIIRLPLDDVSDQHHFVLGRSGVKIAWLESYPGWQNQFASPCIGMDTTFRALGTFAANAMQLPALNYGRGPLKTIIHKPGTPPLDYEITVSAPDPLFATPASPLGPFALVIVDRTANKLVYYYDDFYAHFTDQATSDGHTQTGFEYVLTPVQQSGFEGGLESTIKWFDSPPVWPLVDPDTLDLGNPKTVVFEQGHVYQVLYGAVHPNVVATLKADGAAVIDESSWVAPGLASSQTTSDLTDSQAGNLMGGGDGAGRYILNMVDLTQIALPLSASTRPDVAPDPLIAYVDGGLWRYSGSGGYQQLWEGEFISINQTFAVSRLNGFNLFGLGNAAFYGSGSIGLLDGGARLVLAKVGDPRYRVGALNYRAVLGTNPLTLGGGASPSGTLGGAHKSARVNFERTAP